MSELVAVARFGGRVYWRDKAALFVSVAMSLGLGIGLPLLLGKVNPGETSVLTGIHVGLLGMLLTITAMNQTAVSLTTRRDQLILKRMRATGLRDRDILGGEVLNIVVQSTLVTVTISVVLYLSGAVEPPRDPALFLLALVAGAAVLALLGAAYTAAITRTELAAVMTMPFYLLAGFGGGAFGPMGDLLPGWAQAALDLLPSSAVISALKLAHAGGAWSGYLLPALNLAVWTAVALIAIRLWFRWESRKS